LRRKKPLDGCNQGRYTPEEAEFFRRHRAVTQNIINL